MSRILSSRKLSKPEANLLLNAGISYVDYNAIHISFLDFKVQSPIKNAIITSQNTVRALVTKNISIDHCFCVGDKTKALLEKHHYGVVEKTDYGQDLAHLIVKKHSDKTFTFFCGNKRRKELPHILKENKVDFEEIIVYKNRPNPKRFSQEFDGIMFFSPSQIKSYLIKNQLGNQRVFCIGSTTAAEAEKYTDHISVANKPTVKNVIVQIIKTYKSD